MQIASLVRLNKLEQTLQEVNDNIHLQILDTEVLPDTIDCDALLINVLQSAHLNSILARAPKLRWVHILGTGVDGFPLHLLKDQILTCSRGASATPIAEWTLAMMLAFEKDLPKAWVNEAPERWFFHDMGCLEGKTLGIVGFGGIGQAIAKRALAFDMQVLAKVRTPRPSTIPGVTMCNELETLLTASDHVVLALPATVESKHLINANTLGALKPTAHLINIARADVIDQEALRHTLDNELLARASLDVVEPEPLPQGHWLYSHPRVRVSPHISWSSPRMTQRLLQVFVDNVSAWHKGETLFGVVDREAGY